MKRSSSSKRRWKKNRKEKKPFYQPDEMTTDWYYLTADFPKLEKSRRPATLLAPHRPVVHMFCFTLAIQKHA